MSKRNHVVSQFYYRNFTSTPDKPKNKQKVWTLGQSGDIEEKKIQSICYEKGYNTDLLEGIFSELERFAAESIKRIINGYFNNTDLQNARGYIAYLIANQTHTRKLIRDHIRNHFNASDVEVDNGIFTLIFAYLIAEELNSWESYVYRIQPVKPTVYKELFITSDNPVDTNNYSAIKIGQMPAYGDIENAKIEEGKRVVKYYFDIPTVYVEADTYYFLPLSPITGLYVYRKPSQRESLIQEKHVVSKMNLNQIRRSANIAVGYCSEALKHYHSICTASGN